MMMPTRKAMPMAMAGQYGSCMNCSLNPQNNTVADCRSPPKKSPIAGLMSSKRMYVKGMATPMMRRPIMMKRVVFFMFSFTSTLVDSLEGSP